MKIQPQKNPIFLISTWIWGVLGFWLFLIPTFKAISTTIKFYSTEYLVTDKRAMEKYGFISTHTDEMPLSKVENITVTYSFWGKIFNYGTLQLQGTNYNHITFSYIKNAEEVKKQINSLL